MRPGGARHRPGRRLSTEEIARAFLVPESTAAQSEVLGLVALMELQVSRLPARVDAGGGAVLLPDHDRRRALKRRAGAGS
jgi:predicted RNA polymerase sigma factor